MAQTPNYQPAYQSTPFRRQAYHHPRTSLGAAGHWIREAGILAPLVISELVQNPEQKFRWIRIASVATALVSEGMWAVKIHKEREAARDREANGLRFPFQQRV